MIHSSTKLFWFIEWFLTASFKANPKQPTWQITTYALNNTTNPSEMELKAVTRAPSAGKRARASSQAIGFGWIGGERDT